MAQSAGQVLLGDIGGTKARFALLVDGQLGSIETLLVNDYPGIADAIEAFFVRHRGRVPVTHACLAIAGPVQSDRCVITNSGWLVDAPQLRKALGLQSLRLINDFEATAWSIPHLRPEDVYALGSGQARPGAPAVVASARDRPRHGMFHAEAGRPDRNCFSRTHSRCPVLVTRRMMSSIGCASVSGMFQPNACCRAGAWKIFIKRLPRSRV